jgi:hypothetical protein
MHFLFANMWQVHTRLTSASDFFQLPITKILELIAPTAQELVMNLMLDMHFSTSKKHWKTKLFSN